MKSLAVYAGSPGFPIILGLIALVLGLFLGALLIGRARTVPPGCIAAVNALSPGTWCGSKPYVLDDALSAKYLLVKPGSAAGYAALCGTDGIPLGPVPDEGAAGDTVSVDLLGVAERTQIGVASGAIADGEFLVPGASGKVRKLPSSAGTYYIIGRATGAAADGELIEYQPSFPVQRVVT